MKIFYGKFHVTPVDKDSLPVAAHNIISFIWVRAYDIPDARRNILYHLDKSNFSIIGIETDLTEVNETDFFGKDIGLDNFRKAKANGISLVFFGVADDGITSAGPIELRNKQDSSIESSLSVMLKNKNKGRCLHFNSGERCNSPINAHSIQKSGLLKLIQENGHVYTPSFNIQHARKNNFQPTYQKQSINKISTFLGFCGKHDKELFSPIDDFYLKPTLEQIALYSYRSLCREYFVKENAVNSIKEIADNEKQNAAIKGLLSDLAYGNELGFKDLKYHKKMYDEMFREKDFQQMHYVLYESSNNPNIVFSGILYPDYDFLGNKIQNIGDINVTLKMITFCSTPLEKGWGFLLSWMKLNDDVCVSFIRSLQESINRGNKSEDLLFRLLLLSENHAASPKWIESLSEDAKKEILERLDFYVNPHTDIDPMLLTKGVESYSNWSFESIKSNIE